MTTLLLPLLTALLPSFSLSLPNLATPLSLLLLHLSWTTLVLSYPPLALEITLSLLVRLLCYLVPALCLLVLNLYGIVPFPQIRRGRGRPRKNSGVWTETGGRWRVFAVVLANLLLQGVVQAAVEWVGTERVRWRSWVRVGKSFPGLWEVGRDVLGGLVGREALQYLIHRYLLHPPYSTSLSRLHHAWSHSLPPTPLTPHYDHPIPYLLTRFVPTYAPFIVLRPHLITYVFFLTAISLFEAVSLSGLHGLPWGLDDMSRRCEAHWLGGGRRSFADFGVADRLAGTGRKINNKLYYYKNPSSADEKRKSNGVL